MVSAGVDAQRRAQREVGAAGELAAVGDVGDVVGDHRRPGVGAGVDRRVDAGVGGAGGVAAGVDVDRRIERRVGQRGGVG
jgi:hypothetical protein